MTHRTHLYRIGSTVSAICPRTWSRQSRPSRTSRVPGRSGSCTTTCRCGTGWETGLSRRSTRQQMTRADPAWADRCDNCPARSQRQGVSDDGFPVRAAIARRCRRRPDCDRGPRRDRNGPTGGARADHGRPGARRAAVPGSARRPRPAAGSSRRDLPGPPGTYGSATWTSSRWRPWRTTAPTPPSAAGSATRSTTSPSSPAARNRDAPPVGMTGPDGVIGRTWPTVGATVSLPRHPLTAVVAGDAVPLEQMAGSPLPPNPDEPLVLSA